MKYTFIDENNKPFTVGGDFFDFKTSKFCLFPADMIMVKSSLFHRWYDSNSTDGIDSDCYLKMKEIQNTITSWDLTNHAELLDMLQVFYSDAYESGKNKIRFDIKKTLDIGS